MNILFYGAKGWIGNMIAKKWAELYPKDIIKISNTRVCPQNIDKIDLEIQWAHRVFSTVGRTSGTTKDGTFIPNIDYLETNLNENARDNIFVPILLAQLCKKYAKHLSYLGTGCIFSRDTNNNDYIYSELDTPDFFGSSYSIIKGYTDTLMKTYDNVLNIRIRMPITDDWNPKNFIAKIVNFQNIHSLPNSMTYLPSLIPIMIKLARMNYSGTYNFVNGHISHQEILELYKEIVDPSHQYRLIDEKELSTLLTAKRSNNILDTSKLRLLENDRFIMEGEKIKGMRECVIDALHKMKKAKR